MQYNQKYINFLESIKPTNPTLIEGIIEAYKVIYETTEERVDNLKDLFAGVEDDDDADYDWGSVAPRDSDKVDVPEGSDDSKYVAMFDEMGETELGDEVQYVLDGMGLLGGRKEEEAINMLHSLLKQIEVGGEVLPSDRKKLDGIIDQLVPLIDKRRSGGDSDQEDAADVEKAESAAKRVTKENESFAEMSGDEAADELERELFGR